MKFRMIWQQQKSERKDLILSLCGRLAETDENYLLIAEDRKQPITEWLENILETRYQQVGLSRATLEFHV